MHIEDVRHSAHSHSVKSIAFQNQYQSQITPPILKMSNRTLPSSTSRAPSSTQNEVPMATSSLERLSKLPNIPSNQDGHHEVEVSLPSNQSTDFDEQMGTSQIVTVENPQWIFSFQFPEFPKQIVAKLDNNENIDNVERTAILSRLYDSVTKHTLWVSKCQFNPHYSKPCYPHRCLTVNSA